MEKTPIHLNTTKMLFTKYLLHILFWHVSSCFMVLECCIDFTVTENFVWFKENS